MDELQRFVEDMENLGYSVNARNEFYAFIEAIDSNEKLIKECQKIYHLLDEIVLDKEKNQFFTELKQGTELFRARIIEVEDDNNPDSGVGKTEKGLFTGYNEVNSREPLIGISGNGRDKIAGASYLYVASNQETACMEVKSGYGDLLSLDTFKTNKNMSIIDFSTDKSFQHEDTVLHNMSLGIFFSLLMAQYTLPVKSKKIYRATQILSDYLRKTGVDGIAYKSYLAPGGVNYTIFNSHSHAIKFVNSRVLMHKQANHSFWDFNNKQAIFSNPKNNLMDYDSKIAEEHVKHLSQTFRRTDL
jgi:RES domain.